jgi:DNA-directed RNA polymerase subunit RPC12/RpoP
MTLELGYKCGACANKFAAGMTKWVDGSPHCPTCGEEIIAFPTERDMARHDYIAHTRHDRFHSIVVSGDDDDD